MTMQTPTRTASKSTLISGPANKAAAKPAEQRNFHDDDFENDFDDEPLDDLDDDGTNYDDEDDDF